MNVEGNRAAREHDPATSAATPKSAAPEAVKHAPGPILAGIERAVSHFRADPYGADATPNDVVFVADQAAEIDGQLAALLRAAKDLVADDDVYRETGRVVPRDSSLWANLRAAIAKAGA